MHCFIAGGAGFIGSNLANRLIGKGATVTVYDNLSNGRRSFLSKAIASGRCRFVRGDLLDAARLRRALKGHAVVFHLAASSDISRGITDPSLDLRNGFLSTFALLEAMKKTAVKTIVFASTGAIYGNEPADKSTEALRSNFPLSLYGASKLASEGYLSAFSHLYGINAYLFRFANIVGPNATHGVIFDFIKKLLRDPRSLTILGSGRQRKAYLHVEECIDAMLFVLGRSPRGLHCFHLSSEDLLSVRQIARIVVRAMGLRRVRFTYTGTGGGWPGDQEYVWLDPAKIRRYGWRSRMRSAEAVHRAAGEILAQLTSSVRSSPK